MGVVLALFLAAAVAWLRDSPVFRPAAPPARESTTSAPSGSPGEEQILSAFRARLSNQWVESHGVVERLLEDDTKGSRHQRFILRLSSGHTVLVSHNIDLASRIDNLGPGDRVDFRGEYEWTQKGGVIHWTHHDPAGRRTGGWLDHEGRRYE